MARIIYESQLVDFVADLAKKSRVLLPSSQIGPSADDFRFVEWRPGQTIGLNYPVTILPPKVYLLPSPEVLFRFEAGKTRSPQIQRQVIFGISAEDLEGINRLDKIMSRPVADLPYAERRSKTLLVAIDKYSPPLHLDFDLYLQEFEPGVYWAVAKTKEGKQWLSNPYFKNHNLNLAEVKHRPDPILSDPELPRAIKESAEHPIWAELSQICFGCGICSYVCPLCYCFETEDRPDFGDAACGERCRNWDSCMLRNFAATTHQNFRPELPDRIYNWYFHKFYRLPREYGFSGCVGCNRCTVYCPAKINYRLVLSQVLADYKKRPKK